ncbi:cytochrome P450 [Brasilonema sp. UFV-L1]|uniref:cytochrome P450 n=1 Tax=Brasilonema sp. UFV-L1 TaxID=2234130 RepID=UPI00145CABF4|nr:cytochrome P450 [Brasilonema sp. UFV-L1]NMG08654.1 cytochrome P450 [Brasilonema sp. UFV-L1]
MQLPPGPKTPPFLQLIQWISHPLDYLEKSAQLYGDCFTVRWGNFEAVLLGSPQAFQELFTVDSNYFASTQGLLLPIVGDQSMIMLDGAPHHRQRHLLTPPFHGERMRAYGQLICNIAEQVMETLTISKPFAVRSAMQEISLRVMLDAVFGINEGQRFQQLKELLTSLLDSVSSPLSSSLLFLRSLQRDLGPWSPWGHFLHQQQQINSLIYAEIQQRREHPDSTRTDVLSLLMSACDEDGQPMTNQELRDELITFLVAGHETTATAMSWALYWIHHLPEVYTQLLDELDTISDISDVSIIAKLPYLSAICSETLRLYPVSMLTMPRIVKSPIKIAEHQFEQGTKLIGCIYLAHHREDIYRQPKQFRPERFLERQFSLYEYLPFGGGNRRCIGMAFALFEMKLVLATIVSRYRLALLDQSPVKPVRRGATLAPPDGMQMVVAGYRYQERLLANRTSQLCELKGVHQ